MSQASPTPQPTVIYQTTTTRTHYETAAVLTFVLGLSSLIVWFVPAVVALALGHGAKRNIAASEGMRRGKGLATAGQVLSAITIVIFSLVMVAIGVSS